MQGRMVEHLYSPLSSAEVCSVLGNSLSSVPRARSWDIFPQQPDGFYYGEVSAHSFYLTPVSIHEKGYPTLEIFGVITPTGKQDKPGSYIETRYRPGFFKLLVWTSMLAFFFVFISLALLNFSETGKLSAVIILPGFGLLALTVFALIYKRLVADFRCFIKKELLLQEMSPDE